MATISAMRTAIATALSGISGMQWYDTPPGLVVPPAGLVRRLSTTYGVDFDGNDDHQFGVTLYVALTENTSAQDDLDALLSTSGTNSVKAALEADGTLGGVVEFLKVERCVEEGLATLAGTQCLAATVVVTVGD